MEIMADIKRINRKWCEISRGALAHNFGQVRKKVGAETKIMAVVKADGYGHGAVSTARVFSKLGADYFGVSSLGEAQVLRRRFIFKPILILGYTQQVNFSRALSYRAQMTIGRIEDARELSRVAKNMWRTAKIHIKLDTGMNRIGFYAGEDSERFSKTVEEIVEISKLPNLELVGVFSHLADAEKKTEAFRQFESFNKMVEALRQRGVEFRMRHVANSAATFLYPEMKLDMVRVGIGLYGYDAEGLRLAMSFKTVISEVHKVSAGEKIGYGGEYVMEKEGLIATIPVGYADGFTRRLSGKARVLIRGKYYPVVGNICMDQAMVLVDSTVQVGDKVVIFGDQNGKEILPEELAEKSGTIVYEILCSVGKRVPRYLV
jgi:alanine racemase